MKILDGTGDPSNDRSRVRLADFPLSSAEGSQFTVLAQLQDQIHVLSDKNNNIKTYGSKSVILLKFDVIIGISLIPCARSLCDSDLLTVQFLTVRGARGGSLVETVRTEQ